MRSSSDARSFSSSSLSGRRAHCARHLSNRRFPLEERFGLAQQMRRAAVSIGSNIAEGCGRSGARDLTRFLDIALGSATELQLQLRLSRRFAYVDPDEFRARSDAVRRVERMLIRLILRIRPALETSR